MFIKVIEFLNKSKPLTNPYKGVVVDNEDPRFLGRVKCTIASLFEDGVDSDLLPWIAPINQAGLGGRGDSSSFYVPELGSELIIEFPYECIYTGFYTGFWQSNTTHQGLFNEDYPNSYGFVDKQNTFFKINKTKRYLEIGHTSGSYIKFDNNGDIEISSKRNIKFVSSDGKTTQDYNMNEGTVAVAAKTETSLGGKKTNITSKEFIANVGTQDIKVTGSATHNVSGGMTQKVGGSQNVSIVNNRNTTIAGTESRMVVQKSKDIFGAGYTATVALGNYLVELIAGNYTVDIKAGNISLTTILGSAKIGNALASVNCAPTGSVTIDAKLNAEIKALVSAIVQGTVTAEVKATLIKLGAGTAPIVTIASDPIEDYVSGRPKVGVPTILAG